MIYRYMTEYNKVVAENKDEIKTIIDREKTLKMEIAMIRVEDTDIQHDLRKVEEASRKLFEAITKEFKLNDHIQQENRNIRDLINIVNNRIEERKQENRYTSLVLSNRDTKLNWKQRIEELNNNVLDLQGEIKEISKTTAETKVIGI